MSMSPDTPASIDSPAPAEPTTPLVLRKPLEKSLHAGHPWLYRDALASTPTLADGTIVLIRGRDRRPIGRGFWDATAPIAVRMLTTTAGQSLHQIVHERVSKTLAERQAQLAGTDTTAFRWIHGEADCLPGIHVDLYDDVAAIRFDGAGARAFYGGLPQPLPALLLAADA
ncbi:MAG TPA: hypothetical protein VGG33_04115, partial [Polyangia bacterium]